MRSLQSAPIHIFDNVITNKPIINIDAKALGNKYNAELHA